MFSSRDALEMCCRAQLREFRLTHRLWAPSQRLQLNKLLLLLLLRRQVMILGLCASLCALLRLLAACAGFQPHLGLPYWLQWWGDGLGGLQFWLLWLDVRQQCAQTTVTGTGFADR
jgi:hypothetical protein